MTKPVTIPNTFATATTAIPLSQLDSDFSTVATALNDANTYSNYAADTGVANAYVVTLSGVSTTYSAGLRIQFKAGAANTGASTLNVNGGGTKNITFQDASALSSGTIAANAIVDVMYDGTQFLLMNDPAGATGGDVVGPASATANAAAIFDSTTGKLIKDSKVIITPVANSSTLTIANNKTVTINNTLTLSGTDSTTMTFPSTNATIARTDAAQTFTGTQTFSSDASVNGITVGRGAGAVSTNTAVGASALAAITTGSESTGAGYFALKTATTGIANTAFGAYALRDTTGNYNTAFGRYGLVQNSTGASNTALGSDALYSNTTASNNTAVGYQAGYSNTTGGYNAFFGQGAGYSNNHTGTTGNTFIGAGAGYNNTTGVGNSFLGQDSGVSMTTGSKNTILGRFSGNQGGLDIRTLSNRIVLSDGDGNPRWYIDNVGAAGYGPTTGGAVTQATSRTTGVTLNTPTGAITLVSAAGTTTWQTFTVTNSSVAATDTLIVNQKSGTDLYEIHVTAVAAGSFNISFKTTGGTTTEQPVFNYALIKGQTS